MSVKVAGEGLMKSRSLRKISYTRTSRVVHTKDFFQLSLFILGKLISVLINIYDYCEKNILNVPNSIFGAKTFKYTIKIHTLLEIHIRFDILKP